MATLGIVYRSLISARFSLGKKHLLCTLYIIFPTYKWHRSCRQRQGRNIPNWSLRNTRTVGNDINLRSKKANYPYKNFTVWGGGATPSLPTILLLTGVPKTKQSLVFMVSVAKPSSGRVAHILRLLHPPDMLKHISASYFTETTAQPSVFGLSIFTFFQ